MQLSLLVIGKTDSAQIETEIKRYESRLKHYLPFELRVIPDVRRGSKLSAEDQKWAEGEELLRYITPDRSSLSLRRAREELYEPSLCFLYRACYGIRATAHGSGDRRPLWLRSRGL